MPILINFCLLLTIPSVLHVSSRTTRGVENVKEPQSTRILVKPEDKFVKEPLSSRIIDKLESKPQISPLLLSPQVNPLGFLNYEASSIRKRVLDRSNYYRSIHGIKEFKINPELNSTAQDYANDLAANGNWGQYSLYGEKYGENKFKSSRIPFGDITVFGAIAVDTWYNQIRHVRENMNEIEIADKSDSGVINNLTQLLWKSSDEIGVGMSVDPEDQYFIVVHYNPAGNTTNFWSNLPKFQQTDIDAGVKAHNEMNMKINKFNIQISVC